MAMYWMLWIDQAGKQVHELSDFAESGASMNP